LQQLAANTPARTANEAIGLMQWAADLANQRLGVRREAIAMEFFNGSIDSLDKYSAFVPSKQAYGFHEDGKELKSAVLEENIVGVGIEMKTHELGALVMGTVENGPAHRARIQKGDILTGVDGRSLAGMSLSQIADLVAGPAGSTVTFRVQRSNQEYTASVRRENVYVSSVASVQMLDQSTGYMRLKQFSESSAEDLEKNMWNLYKTGMRSLVLDLRGNPGGLLTEAVQVSNLYLPSGRIVATKGRTAADDSDERASFEKTWKLPLVVLVDEHSASASEIFAAAIQENGRGVIVGRTTYGKGTVQTHFPLQSVTGNLKLTTAKFYSPQGREMANVGVRPDVTVNGNTDDFLTAAITSDLDVRTALQVMAQGTPASLAASNQQNRPSYDLSQIGN
jgi:carboxyl-terminal processing protease